MWRHYLCIFLFVIEVWCDCGRSFNENSGTFFSPNYPKNYENNLKCAWNITVPKGNVVQLKIIPPFDVESKITGGCQDKIIVYDGTVEDLIEGKERCSNDKDVPILVEWCGNKVPRYIHSTTNKVFVHFCTDKRMVRTGFQMRWESLDESALSYKYEACGSKLHVNIGEIGFIQSHKYYDGISNEYPDNYICTYYIIAPPGRAIQLDAEHFKVEPSSQCTTDRLEVYDGNNDLIAKLGTFCGINGPRKIVSETNNFFIKFITDQSFGQTGFKIKYSVVDKIVRCSSDEFTCSDGNCIPITNYCDEKVDCPDGSDELNCGGKCGAPIIPPITFFRIAGGIGARKHSWPWLVSLIRPGSKNHFCGGALIHPQWVLTASHCIVDRETPMVRIGEDDLRVKEENEQDMKVIKAIMHPNFKKKTLNNDIALLKLEKPTTFNDGVNKICLPSIRPQPGMLCYSAGWGLIKHASAKRSFENEKFEIPEKFWKVEIKGAAELQQVRLPLVNQSLCNHWYNGMLTENMMCAGYEHGGRDSCQGDSGGPFMCKINGRWEIHGVVSWGTGCASAKKPGVYAIVNNYLAWIENIVTKE